MSQLSLAKIDESDLKALYTWRNDPNIYRWCRQFEPISWVDHLKWFKLIYETSSIRMYKIMVDSNQLVGVCGLTSIDYVNSRAEFSLYIGSEYQYNGYGEMALRALVEHGFFVLNLNCIWGEAFDRNPAIRMFKRVGFEMEGRRRDFYYRDGRFIDAHLFSLRRSDYKWGINGVGNSGVKSGPLGLHSDSSDGSRKQACFKDTKKANTSRVDTASVSLPVFKTIQEVGPEGK